MEVNDRIHTDIGYYLTYKELRLHQKNRTTMRLSGFSFKYFCGGRHDVGIVPYAGYGAQFSAGNIGTVRSSRRKRSPDRSGGQCDTERWAIS